MNHRPDREGSVRSTTPELLQLLTPEFLPLQLTPEFCFLIASVPRSGEDLAVQNRAGIGFDVHAVRQKFLQAIPIFAGLTTTALTEIACAVEETAFHKDDIIVREGEPGNRMFIIGQGSVEVVKNLGRSRETVLAVLLPNDFLGEMSIIECVARSASVRAIEETVLFAIKGIDLYHLFQKYPDQYAIVMLNIARDISRRLRALDERFAAISH
jgi:CRP/FNR family transcriptional regulator, cyclic AMP receptor protein